MIVFKKLGFYIWQSTCFRLNQEYCIHPLESRLAGGLTVSTTVPEQADDAIGDLGRSPASLALPEQELWRRIVASYVLPDDDPAVWTILRGLCEAAGTARLANEAVKEHGVLIRAGSGGMKANPAVNIAHQAREQLIRHARALGLNLEPLNDRPGRPPAHGTALL
jgi:P27 family predicted phage terminase small subunit